MKNTSLPLTLASTNVETSLLVPLEMRYTRPPSYSYTSCLPFTSPGTSASMLLKNTREPSPER